ncbi:MAG: BREX-1 system phosphatase PglZ type B [Saprospiraceae bacterium]|nr:BREX-1 system phosphatase PglZ type B [Saprospiraceae bacterium]
MNEVFPEDKIVENLRKAAEHNSQIMVRPEVILWPDPDRQFEAVIPVLQQSLPELLVLGPHQSGKKQGPAIWMKCMIARSLPEAVWPETATPILYLPGMTKQDFKNIPVADPHIQPLMEYQYTGTLFTQKNGREWTVLAFMENEQDGMGLRVAQDNVTKDYLIHVLSMIFQDRDMPWPQTIVDANFLQGLLFPDAAGSILKWLCKGDDYLAELPEGKVEAFMSICSSRFGFEPDYRNRIDCRKLGSQRNEWKQVWHYANAPNKYPKLEPLLRLAKPDDLGTGMFAYPEESWPQVNEQKEDELRKALQSAAKLSINEAFKHLEALHVQHACRRKWVWCELGQSPLALALPYLLAMTDLAMATIPASSIDELTDYYTQKGYVADQSMRKALACVKSEKDKRVVIGLITSVYKPWLHNISTKFQSLVAIDATIFTNQTAIEETEHFVLFVDAFRYELAKEFYDRLGDQGYKINLQVGWSAIPSLTPTAKANVSPIATIVSTTSDIKEFRPQLNNGKDLNTANFRAALAENGFEHIPNSSAIDAQKKQWQEIGEIDTKGHAEFNQTWSNGSMNCLISNGSH